MYFAGLGTATPIQRYTQAEIWKAFQSSIQFNRLAPRSRKVLDKVLNGDNGIDTRHLSIDSLEEAFVLEPDVLHARFVRHAPLLATEAARQSLDDAGLQPDDVDALLVSTCTGYLCPGLTSYVSERLGLRPQVQLLDLVGQGCGAALPNLRTANALLASGSCQRVLSVCVEVCSAAFYLDDDPGVLISACLFGDGAAAAVLVRDPPANRRRVKWRSAGSLLSAEDRDYLRFEQRGGMLRNILSRQVPALAAKHVETVLTDTLQHEGMRKEQITGWILHGGGRDVLNALAARLGLAEEDLSHSRTVLREHGNMSSPFVLMALQRALAQNARGGWWWMSSFGAGFSCHGALLEVG